MQTLTAYMLTTKGNPVDADDLTTISFDKEDFVKVPTKFGREYDGPLPKGARVNAFQYGTEEQLNRVEIMIMEEIVDD